MKKMSWKKKMSAEKSLALKSGLKNCVFFLPFLDPSRECSENLRIVMTHYYLQHTMTI